MMRDIGLHLSPNQLHDYEDLDTGELEARKRLYLSAYVWDKYVDCFSCTSVLTLLQNNQHHFGQTAYAYKYSCWG